MHKAKKSYKSPLKKNFTPTSHGTPIIFSGKFNFQKISVIFMIFNYFLDGNTVYVDFERENSKKGFGAILVHVVSGRFLGCN